MPFDYAISTPAEEILKKPQALVYVRSGPACCIKVQPGLASNRIYQMQSLKSDDSGGGLMGTTLKTHP